MKNRIIKTALVILAAFTFASCNKEDDIQEIFIDRSWTLTFIQEGKEHFVPQNNAAYIISFKGNTFTLTTPANATISGNWQADGGSRTFRCSSIRTSGNITNDDIAKRMRNMLQNAVSYNGDANYLQIIVQQGNAFMQFYNK